LWVSFRHTDKSKDEERELIIFLTPRIVREPKAMDLAKEYSKDLEREQEIPLPNRTKKAVEKTLDEIERKKR